MWFGCPLPFTLKEAHLGAVSSAMGNIQQMWVAAAFTPALCSSLSSPPSALLRKGKKGAFPARVLRLV